MVKSFLCLPCKKLVTDFYQGLPAQDLREIYGQELPEPDPAALVDYNGKIETRKQMTLGLWNERRKNMEKDFISRIKEVDTSNTRA